MTSIERDSLFPVARLQLHRRASAFPRFLDGNGASNDKMARPRIVGTQPYRL